MLRAAAALGGGAVLMLAACGPPPLPRVAIDLSEAAGPAPVDIVLVEAYENRTTEPYAPLVAPRAVAIFPDRHFLLADAAAGLVHRFDPDGFYDGALDAADADFIPIDLVAHGFHLFVLDGASRWVLRFTDQGIFRDRAFIPQDFAPAADPVALAADRDGRFAVADVANHQVHLTGPFFGPETTVGSYGSFEGQLDDPRGVAFGLDGLLYVSEAGNRRVQIFDRTGLSVGSTLSMGGVNDLFVAPRGLDTDRHGNVYVADEARGVVVILAPDLTPLAEIGHDPHLVEALRRPVDCAVSLDDRLYVVDAGRRALLVFQLVYP